MDILEKMKGSFSSDESKIKIVENELQFKVKLNIGDEAFGYLKNAKNIQHTIEVLMGGGMAAGATYLGWAGSIGVLGQVGLALGLVATPIGLIALAGGLGTAAMFGMKKLGDGAESKAFTKIPNFINTPLDILAINIFQVLVPVAVKIALSDGLFDKSERDCITKSLQKDWGFSDEFISLEIAKVIENIDDFEFRVLRSYIDDVFKDSADIDVSYLKQEVIQLAWEIVNADGHIDEKELLTFECLKLALLGNKENVKP